MKLYTDKEAINLCAGKYLLLDNDFLSELLRDEEILKEKLKQEFKEKDNIISNILDEIIFK